jgi:predicted ATPase/class 3 adenylate cyclase
VGGSHPEHLTATGPPTGVVTFLFTDIEGSTRRWESDADSMRSALAAHDDVLRNAIAAQVGWLFKHTGDGVCAAFTSPRAAVDAAVAAQRRLELPVRMGIATGEAELRGDDYFGAALNRAARVMAAGHGGQILLADSTSSLLTRFDLIDLGRHRLRDLPNPIGVFQVRADGLAEDFPPLRTTDASPGNLRPQATTFIGRDGEVPDVISAFHTHRLMTLTGVGGVGKTRLALEVAANIADEFPDGIWVFELAAIGDPAALPDAVAAVLGISQQPGATLTDSIAAAQEDRARLLVFDNCEHVLAAAADLIEAILSRSETVRILATSREGLGVPDEQLWPVPSLSLADGADSAAVRLFVERAVNVAPRFSLAKPDDADAVQEICRRLDGIPLAIELAASRMASMTASEVRDRLDQRFRLLVGSRRGVERHQTLRHAVAWSYEHLDDAEKSLLDRCSVFAGGFDLESACAVAELDTLDEFVILDRLDALVRKSLLNADRSSARTRYSMLETIRQFAEEQLVANGTPSQARAAHARHFAGRETDVLALWDSPRQCEAYDWFTVEAANLRSAFRWSADHQDLDTAATIATYAAFLGCRIENYEPIAWTEELIEAAREVEHPRLAYLYVMASRCYAAGRIEQAIHYCDAGQAVIETGRYEVPFGIEGLLGGPYVAIGRPEKWVASCRALVARSRDPHILIRTCLVFALAIAGSGDEARSAADGLMPAAEASRNPYVFSWVSIVYGYAFYDTDPGSALEVLRRALLVAKNSGNRTNESHLAVSVCRLEAEFGNLGAALDYAALTIRIFVESGSTTNLRSPLAFVANFLDRLGHYEPAATTAGFAFNPFTSTSYPQINDTIAHLREVLGDAEYESLASLGAAMTIAQIVNYAYEQIDLARAEMSRSRTRRRGS